LPQNKNNRFGQSEKPDFMKTPHSL